MAYRDFKNVTRRTDSDKARNIMGIKGVLLKWSTNFLT